LVSLSDKEAEAITRFAHKEKQDKDMEEVVTTTMKDAHYVKMVNVQEHQLLQEEPPLQNAA
jgi:hypothetical protein